jgi:hypothetical protein
MTWSRSAPRPPGTTCASPARRWGRSRRSAFRVVSLAWAGRDRNVYRS